jgi:flagellar protein FliL
MADEDLDDEPDEDVEDDSNGDGEGDDDEEEGGGSDKGKGGGGKKKLFIIVGLALLLVGGAAGAYFTGLLDPLLGGDESQTEEGAILQDAVFYDMEELVVTLSTEGREATFLKIKISLELEKQEDVPKLESLLPRVIGNFQIYLRELRIEDLRGSAGMYRLREELLKRVTAAISPVKVNDVLFKEMLVQ